MSGLIKHMLTIAVLYSYCCVRLLFDEHLVFICCIIKSKNTPFSKIIVIGIDGRKFEDFLSAQLGGNKIQNVKRTFDPIDRNLSIVTLNWLH